MTSAATTTGAQVSSYYGVEAPFPVGSIPSATLHDPQRNKDLSMSIEYPTRGGPYPVIVFSHGYGSSSEGYISLTPVHFDLTDVSGVEALSKFDFARLMQPAARELD